jgi:uncharacterized membrane protein
MALGPVQMLVISFDSATFSGEIRAELERLRAANVVRLIDMIVIRKDENGNVERLQHSDLSEQESEEFGAVVGALIGLGMAGEVGVDAGIEAGIESVRESGHLLNEDVWFVADEIQPGHAAAVALLEHRWALPLRDAIVRAGGHNLVDAWIHPEDLIAVGLLAGDEVAAS